MSTLKMYFSCFIIAIFSCFLCIGQEQGKGGYTHCKRYSYKYKFGEIDIQSKTEAGEIHYNSSGNIITESGTLQVAYGRNEYTYDTTGNNVKIVHYSFDGLDSRVTRIRYIDNKKVEQIIYKDDGNVYSKFTYSYNTTGKLAQEQQFSADGILQVTINYTYDEYGNMTLTGIDNNGNTLNVTTEKYDSKGRIIETTYIMEQYNLKNKWTNEYDSNGNMSKTIGLNCLQNEIITIKSFQYDSFGNVLEEIQYDALNEPKMKIEYKYD